MTTAETNPMAPSGHSTNGGGDFVTHQEFSTFARRVESSMSAIAEEVRKTREEGAERAVTAASAGKLGVKELTGIGSVMVAMVVGSMGMVALIGGMALTPIRSGQEAISERMAVDDQREIKDRGDSSSLAAVVAGLGSESTRLSDETTRTRDWMEGHDLRVRGLNAAQWERIKGLERQVFGASFPVTDGEGFGAGD